jgi:hypothetical protein
VTSLMVHYMKPIRSHNKAMTVDNESLNKQRENNMVTLTIATLLLSIAAPGIILMKLEVSKN